MTERNSLVGAARRAVSAAKAAAAKTVAGKPVAGKTVAGKTVPAPADAASPSPATPEKKASPVKRGASAKKAPAKPAAPTKQASPAEQAAPATQAAPAKRASPATKVAPAKNAAPAKKTAPAKAAQVRKVTAEPEAAVAASAPPEQDPARATATPTFAVRTDESPWTGVELAEIRAELAGELDRIARDVETLQSSIADVLRDSGDGAGDDQADTGSKAFEREQEMTLLANTRESLFQTRRALTRIDDGSYGSCEACGNPVGKLRLQAFPRATLCVSCKQAQERR